MAEDDGLGRVLIVDDHKLFAEVIQPALHGAGIGVIGVVDNARDAFQAVAERTPDLVLMDIGLPDANGIEVGKSLLARHPETKVLVVSVRKDPNLIKEAMRAGFNGYVIKDTPIAQFIAAVKSVLAGDVVVPKHLRRRAAGARSPAEEDALRRAEYLTHRELEVLTLLTEGATSEDIAARLSISPNTVRTHIQNILTKLQVRSRFEAATFAVRFGIVNPQRHDGNE
jgi:two-component system, NarL family, nitrate/nitrite response regulator NarL